MSALNKLLGFALTASMLASCGDSGNNPTPKPIDPPKTIFKSSSKTVIQDLEVTGMQEISRNIDAAGIRPWSVSRFIVAGEQSYLETTKIDLFGEGSGFTLRAVKDKNGNLPKPNFTEAEKPIIDGLYYGSVTASEETRFAIDDEKNPNGKLTIKTTEKDTTINGTKYPLVRTDSTYSKAQLIIPANKKISLSANKNFTTPSLDQAIDWAINNKEIVYSDGSKKCLTCVYPSPKQ